MQAKYPDFIQEAAAKQALYTEYGIQTLWSYAYIVYRLCFAAALFERYGNQLREKKNCDIMWADIVLPEIQVDKL